MKSSDVLTTSWDDVAPLRDPVFLIALRGWFDVSGAATQAIEWCVRDRVVTIVGSIDPDPFFDFTQERPEVFLDEDDERQIRWPENDIYIARFPEGNRDLVLLAGVEPHIHWSTFIDAIVEVAQGLKCSAVVTLGALADQVPHTRLPPVVGSTTNPDLARRLGLQQPQYQGPTGVIGVMQERFDRTGLPAVSLRVGVPHYLTNAQHPRSTAALLRHLEHVLGVPPGHAHMDGEVRRWAVLHEEAVEDDTQALAYVRMLEQQFDQRSEASMPSGDDLAAEFEKFLRDQNPDT
ncbi:MAG: PAC2 family protein [Actinomycetota bacterium]